MAKLKLPAEFWVPTPIEPNPFLSDLRSGIVDAPTPPKRTPKWRFWCAPHLAIEIQPKDSVRVLFECRVLEGEGIDASSFTGRRADRRDLREMSFTILKSEDGQWLFKPRYAYAEKIDGTWSYAGIIVLRARLVSSLVPEEFIGQAVMLSWNCLICGKGLVDPASRARLIGPECAGTSSLVVPLRLAPRDNQLVQ